METISALRGGLERDSRKSLSQAPDTNVEVLNQWRTWNYFGPERVSRQSKNLKFVHPRCCGIAPNFPGLRNDKQRWVHRKNYVVITRKQETKKKKVLLGLPVPFSHFSDNENLPYFKHGIQDNIRLRRQFPKTSSKPHTSLFIWHFSKSNSLGMFCRYDFFTLKLH